MAVCLETEEETYEATGVVKGHFTGSLSANIHISIFLGDVRFDLAGQWEPRGNNGYQLARRR